MTTKNGGGNGGAGRKTVTTWAELEEECIKLDEFYDQAAECLQDILAAVQMRSEVALRDAVTRWSGLKALPTFTIDPVLYAAGKKVKLSLVN